MRYAHAHRASSLPGPTRREWGKGGGPWGRGGLLGCFRNVLTSWFWRQGGDWGKSPGLEQISLGSLGPSQDKGSVSAKGTLAWTVSCGREGQSLFNHLFPPPSRGLSSKIQALVTRGKGEAGAEKLLQAVQWRPRPRGEDRIGGGGCGRGRGDFREEEGQKQQRGAEEVE